MSEIKLILTYSSRIVIRQWRRFVLPFFSLTITAIVLALILLITESSTILIQEKSRSLLGGDVVIESTAPIDSGSFWKLAGITPEKQSNQISFSGTLQSEMVTAPFSIQVIDQNFPLYGKLVLKNDNFTGIKDKEIFIDEAGAKKLGVVVGSNVLFGSESFIVGGIIDAEPTSLFSGFRFFPQAIINETGFKNSGISPELLRAEYIYAGLFNTLSEDNLKNIRAAKDSFSKPIDVNIAGEDQRGLQFGLKAVSNFLLIAVLITSILSAVNVYASTLYLVGVEKRNLAVLLAIGLRKKTLVQILGSTLGYIVILSCLFGIFLGKLIFSILSSYISSVYFIQLPVPNIILFAFICFALVTMITIASFIPAVAKTLSLNPKQILIGGEMEQEKKSKIFSISLCTLLPLIVFASFLFKSIFQGVVFILALSILYTTIAGLFSFIIFVLYKNRAKYSFFIRSIISQKKADGFFGIVSFTSLFIALVSIGSLALIQLSLEKFLTNDLAQTVPSTYVLDIQPSQKEILINQFPDINLFENIRARIISIDGLNIQEELVKSDTTIDRELGREYNLTARSDLLPNEFVTKGVWGDGKPGEISVDESFAKRANINIGSKIIFSIQGFEVGGTVTSFRETDSRSGLPFFFFILSPQDLANFPSVFFGYSYADTDSQNKLSQFVASQMPNISVLDTQTIGSQIVQIVQTLLLLVLIITLPSLLIATLLIATLVVSSYESRRREGARLRAIGATRIYILIHYLAETVSITLISTIISYAMSILISFFVNKYFLKFTSNVFFDIELFIGLILIILFIGFIGFYLFKKDTMPLRELISYEANL